VGGVLSTTVTVKDAVPVLPWLSVEVQVTVVVPNENVAPELGLQVGVSDPSKLSVALAEKVTAAPLGLVASTVMLPGTITIGGVASTSTTVTLKDAVAVFPCASVALQVTVVVPTGKVLPELGLQLGVSAPSTLSVALAVYVTGTPLALVALTVMSAGTVTTGGVVSVIATVTVKDDVAVF